LNFGDCAAQITLFACLEGNLRILEYLRPWKLFSLACGIGLLIAGAYHHEAPDWDVPISLIMAALTYLTAPNSMRVILERRWRLWPAMLLATWFTVDGSYWMHWSLSAPLRLWAHPRSAAAL
jgi:hypothetical protein